MDNIQMICDNDNIKNSKDFVIIINYIHGAT